MMKRKMSTSLLISVVLTTLTILPLITASITFPSSKANSNIVVNGSFESPEVDTTPGWDTFPSGSPGLGWAVEWMPGVDLTTPVNGQTPPLSTDPANIELHEPPMNDFPGSAQDGDQYTELDSDWQHPPSPPWEPASIKISQNLPTVSGMKYLLSFYFSPRPNPANPQGSPIFVSTSDENRLGVYWDGSQLDLISAAGGSSIDWTYYSYTVQATSDNTLLEFADLGIPNSFGTFLDNIKVTPIPPPGAGTPGYWKNHPGKWPVEEIEIGGITYTKAEAIVILKAKGRGDRTYAMFRALVATKLNVLMGNPDSCIADTITDADAWMATYGPVGNGVKGWKYAWRVLGEPLKDMLDQYNNGLLCAPPRV